MPAFATLTGSFDTDKDGKLTKAELGEAEIADHFGWADANKDEFIDAAEWTFISDGMSSKDYGLVAFQLENGAKEASEIWRHKRGLPAIATPLIADGVLYLIKDGGLLTTLDAASGKELGFERLEEATGSYAASPVAAAGKVFLASSEGRIVVLEAGGNPVILAQCDLGEPIHATPAIGGGALFVRTEQALYCFASSGGR